MRVPSLPEFDRIHNIHYLSVLYRYVITLTMTFHVIYQTFLARILQLTKPTIELTWLQRQS